MDQYFSNNRWLTRATRQISLAFVRWSIRYLVENERKNPSFILKWFPKCVFLFSLCCKSGFMFYCNRFKVLRVYNILAFDYESWFYFFFKDYCRRRLKKQNRFPQWCCQIGFWKRGSKGKGNEQYLSSLLQPPIPTVCFSSFLFIPNVGQTSNGSWFLHKDEGYWYRSTRHKDK